MTSDLAVFQTILFQFGYKEQVAKIIHTHYAKIDVMSLARLFIEKLRPHILLKVQSASTPEPTYLFHLNHSGRNTINCQILAWGTIFHWETADWWMPKILASSVCEPANAINLSLSILTLYISPLIPPQLTGIYKLAYDSPMP